MKAKIKRILASILTLCVTCSLLTGLASAADSKLSEKFPEIRTYSNQFKDVSANAWYKDFLMTAYNSGIISGTSESTFSPNGNVTLAQAIVMADRIHSEYIGEQTSLNSLNSGVWYQPYVDYAIKEKIIADGRFADYSRPATRGEIAYLFVNAFPIYTLSEINNYIDVFDVDRNDDYYYQIVLLYRAGVVNGCDENGSYFPDQNITRAQVAVMIGRLIDPQKVIKAEEDTNKPDIIEGGKSYFWSYGPVCFDDVNGKTFWVSQTNHLGKKKVVKYNNMTQWTWSETPFDAGAFLVNSFVAGTVKREGPFILEYNQDTTVTIDDDVTITIIKLTEDNETKYIKAGTTLTFFKNTRVYFDKTCSIKEPAATIAQLRLHDLANCKTYQ